MRETSIVFIYEQGSHAHFDIYRHFLEDFCILHRGTKTPKLKGRTSGQPYSTTCHCDIKRGSC